MKTKYLFIIAAIGIAVGIVTVIITNVKFKAPPPVAVSYNPYDAGIYSTGIIETYQLNGSNINIFPEVAARVTDIMVTNGQEVKKGMPLIALDDSVQAGIVEKDLAEIGYARASLVNVQQQLEKMQKAYSINPKSVSGYDLDNAINAVKVAKESVKVAQGQYDSDVALLEKYILTSPIDGIVLRIVPAIGDYAYQVGSYDIYTQTYAPTIALGVMTPYLQVRAYVDEILVPNLPDPSKLEATLFVRGLINRSVPLEFSSLQPFTIPNIELSDERNERVDVRVLPIIFRFEKPSDINLFPGQLVDVYIKGKP